MHGKRAFFRVPEGEGERERNAEEERTYFERNTQTVSEVVSDQGAEDAYENHCGPVDAGHVPARLELEEERDHEQQSHHDRSDGKTEIEIDVKKIGGGL